MNKKKEGKQEWTDELASNSESIVRFPTSAIAKTEDMAFHLEYHRNLCGSTPQSLLSLERIFTTVD